MKNKRSSITAAIIIVIIVITVFTILYSEYKKLTKPFLKCNDHILTAIEYEYFYNSYRNHYINTYSAFFDYMGVDSEIELDDQEYEDGMTFAEMFAKATDEQIKETYALYDDGIKQGFIYDSQNAFDEYLKAVTESCNQQGTSTLAYFRAFYGDRITEKNIREYMSRGFYAAAYYDEITGSMGADGAYIYLDELKKQYEITYY